MTMNFFKEEKRMKIKKLGIIAAAAIMGISVAAPATSRNSCNSGSTNHGSSQTRKQA